MGEDPGIPPHRRQAVNVIRRGGEHLLSLIEGTLDIARIEAGKLRLEVGPMRFADCLHEMAGLFELQAAGKGLAFRFEAEGTLPEVVRADERRLRQILINLLDNAIKFTAQGQVLLRVSQVGERLRCEVHDTGRGIAPERQAHIFNRFEYADVQTNRTYGGTGLGLTICDKLVHLMHGEIGLHSMPGQGSVFWLELPLQPALAPAEPQQEQNEDATTEEQTLDILVVDDNAVNLMVARLQLQKVWPRARITTVGSAAQALQLLDVQGFDVALVDMIMPEMDGMQLTQQIRQRFPAITARMPIIALTANTNPVERERCLAAGMDDVLHKPVDTDSLLRSVNGQIRRLRGAA